MGFFEKLENAWNIFTTSLSFIGKDKSLLVVPFIMILSVAGIAAFFFLRVILPGTEIPLFLVLFLLVIALQFWLTFLGAVQSWMVHEVAQNKDTTFMSGVKRAFSNLGDIFLFVLVKMLVAAIASKLRKRGGTAGHVAGGFLSTVAGIAGKLVLPAMIVTERNFTQSVKQLRDAIPAIPEIATFEIGLTPLRMLVGVIYTIFCIAIGLIFGLMTGLILFALFVALDSTFAILINQIYYTLLYLTLIEKKKIHGLNLK